MTKRFSGWHMTAILVAFFGIVVAVNVVMAVSASRTFGGTVVDNSYVASQSFNGWLAEAREQAALGWEERVARREEAVEIAVRSPAGPLENAEVTAVAMHPLGRTRPVPLRFAEAGAGVYRSVGTLPEGRWIVRIEVLRDGRVKRIRADVR